MAHQHDRRSRRLQLMELLTRLRLEVRIPHREDLIDHQDVGTGMDRHREPQPHIHAAGVVLHRVVDEAGHSREFDDLVELRVDVVLGHPQDRAVQVDILASAELRVESGADFEHRRQAPLGDDLPLIGLEDSGDALQQRRLAGTVMPHETEGRAPGHLKGDAVDSLEVLRLRATALQDRALQRLIAVMVDAERLRDVLDADGGVRHHSSSTIRAW